MLCHSLAWAVKRILLAHTSFPLLYLLVGCGSRTVSSLHFEYLEKALVTSLLAHLTPVS